MYSKDSALEKQVYIGPFLGPFMALLTMAIALFYYSPEQMELPLSGLCAIYLSWRWRLRGAAIAWTLLAAAGSYVVLTQSDKLFWWNITLTASLALASLITALTHRNVRRHLEWKYQDSVEQQSRLAIVEGRLNTILQTVHQERADAQALLDNLREQLKEKVAKHDEHLEYVEIARRELLETQKENEKLQQESTEILQKALKTQEESEQLKGALNSYKNQEATLHEQKAEIEELRKTLGAFQHQIASYKDDLGRARQQQALVQEMGEMIDTLTREKALLESSLANLQSEFEKAQSDKPVEVVVDEKSPADLRRLEGFYRQLREQFEEKSKVLDETRKELFQTQEKLSAAELETNEKELASPQIPLEEHVRHLAHLEEELKHELELSHQEIGRLYQLIDSIIPKGVVE